MDILKCHFKKLSLSCVDNCICLVGVLIVFVEEARDCHTHGHAASLGLCTFPPPKSGFYSVLRDKIPGLKSLLS